MAQKKRWGYFGLKTGANFSTLRLDEGNDNVDNNWKTGFVLGAFVKIPASAKVDIQPEFLYSSMGGGVTTGVPPQQNYRLNYFSIPVLVKYNFHKQWTAVLGPQVDFLIQGKTNNGTKITNSLNETGFGATGGFEYWLKPNTVFLGARYFYGFTNVWGDDATQKWYNHGAQLTIGFQLAK